MTRIKPRHHSQAAPSVPSAQSVVQQRQTQACSRQVAFLCALCASARSRRASRRDRRALRERQSTSPIPSVPNIGFVERQEERWRPLADSRIPNRRRGAAIRSLDWFCVLMSSAGLGLKHTPPTRYTALTTALEQHQTFVHMHKSLVTQRAARTAKRPSRNAAGDHTQNDEDHR